MFGINIRLVRRILCYIFGHSWVMLTMHPHEKPEAYIHVISQCARCYKIHNGLHDLENY